MVIAHGSAVKAQRTERALLAEAAKLQETTGDEQAMEEVLKRRKEVRKENMSANGSALKKKHRKDATPSHPRFTPGVSYLSWPPTKGPPSVPVSNVPPDHRRVKWEVGQIFAHLVEVFGDDEAAAKMDHLTATKTRPGFIKKMKD
jgi:hypothetical protein